MTSKLDGLVRVGTFNVIWFRDGSMNIKVFNLVGCQSTLCWENRFVSQSTLCWENRFVNLPD